MVNSWQRRATTLFFLLIGILPVPVLARTARTGVSPLNRVIELLSNLFDIPILQDARIQVLFIRFGLFIIILALSHFALRHVFVKSGEEKFGNKISGIISAVIALISALLMPENWVTASGGVITALFSALIPLGIVGLGLWFAMGPLCSSTWANTATRLIALVILLMLLTILEVYQVAVLLPAVIAIPVRWLRGDA